MQDLFVLHMQSGLFIPYSILFFNSLQQFTHQLLFGFLFLAVCSVAILLVRKMLQSSIYQNLLCQLSIPVFMILGLSFLHAFHVSLLYICTLLHGKPLINLPCFVCAYINLCLPTVCACGH